MRHGPLIERPPGCAVGWVRVICDCGWKGEPVPSILYAIEAYGDHRAD